MSVTEVMEAVKELSPEEREQVKHLIEGMSAAPESPEDRVSRILYERGLLLQVKHAAARSATPSRRRQSPVSIIGKPLSETIIEERARA